MIETTFTRSGSGSLRGGREDVRGPGPVETALARVALGSDPRPEHREPSDLVDNEDIDLPLVQMSFPFSS